MRIRDQVVSRVSFTAHDRIYSPEHVLCATVREIRSHDPPIIIMI